MNEFMNLFRNFTEFELVFGILKDLAIERENYSKLELAEYLSDNGVCVTTLINMGLIRLAEDE